MASHYQSKHAKPAKRSAAVIVIIIIAAVLLLGAGGYALYNFVLSPQLDKPVETTAPTVATEKATIDEAPTEAPTEAAEAESPYVKAAKDYVISMSEDEKICQLFIVTPEALTGVDAVNAAGETTKEALAKYPVGGIIYFSDNLEDEAQIKEMIENSQSYSKTPLFISVDEEGGDVSRVADAFQSNEINNMYTYKDEGADTAKNNAEQIAESIAALGFNLDFAPVADVWSNKDNTVIGERAYSDDFKQASELVSAAVEGFSKGGVLSVLKHFPGHGDTAEDSHEQLATVKKTAEQLISEELLPFKAGIEAGADMVMVGHIIVSNIDDQKPATLSDKVVPTLLRDKLGYDGAVITDSLSMNSIADNYSVSEIVSGVLSADIDIMLMPNDLDAYLKAVKAAISSGELSEEQLNAKVIKILALKYKAGIISDEKTSETETKATEPATSAVTTAPETKAAETKPTETQAPQTEEIINSVIME